MFRCYLLDLWENNVHVLCARPGDAASVPIWPDGANIALLFLWLLYMNVYISSKTKCSHFKSFIFIGPFKISTDNYHAVDDSALCVYTV